MRILSTCINHTQTTMQIGKLPLYPSRSSRYLVVIKSLMLVFFIIIIVGQGAYGIVVAAKDKQAIDKTK